MNRDECLVEFNEKIVQKYLEEYCNKFHKNIERNTETIKNLIFNSLKDICDSKNIITEEDKITVLQFEILRTDILNESYKIRLNGYNNLFYLDENPVSKYIDFKFLFNEFLEFKNKLIEESKVYVGKVNKYDIQKILFDVVIKCYINMSFEVRRWLWDFEEQNLLKKEALNDFYQIKWGEYQGISEVVFSMDNREKTIEDFKNLKKQSKSETPYIYTVWKNCEFKGIEEKEENLMFINFKGSLLQDSNFLKSQMITSQFKNSKIKGCKFINSILAGSVFENSIIENSKFNNSNLIGVNFNKASLKEVCFKGCNLKQSNFIDVKFEDVSFEEADLEGAVFNEEDIPFIKLSPEQLQTIVIYGGDN